MKDILNKLFRMMLSLLILGYLSYLFYFEINLIGQEEDFYSIANIISFLICIIFSFLLIFDSIKPFCFNKPRLIYLSVGLFLILFGNYGITDNSDLYLFLGDIFSLLGVIIVILGIAGFLTYTSCIKKIEESKIEIIEV